MTYSLSKKHTCFSRYRPSSISRMGYLRICSKDLIVFLAETKSILQMYLDASTQSLHLSLTPLNREGRFNSICQLCATYVFTHFLKKGNPFLKVSPKNLVDSSQRFPRCPAMYSAWLDRIGHRGLRRINDYKDDFQRFMIDMIVPPPINPTNYTVVKMQQDMLELLEKEKKCCFAGCHGTWLSDATQVTCPGANTHTSHVT